MKYILYCRKSTDTDDKQALSLDSQKKEMTDFAYERGLEIIEVMTESMSAKSVGRPIFNDMIKKIETGKADGIICWKLDRLARNFIDGGKIIDLLQKGIIKEIQTFEGVHKPTDNVILIAVNFGGANQYIRDLSSNVKRGNRAKLEKGEWPNHAPFGYKNDKATKTVVVNKKTATFVIRAFELYSTGGYTIQQVADILYSEGLRTVSGNKVFKNHIHRVLTSRFYCGLMERDGKVYNGNHTPLISVALCEKVQDILHCRNHPKPKKHFYSARGFLTCAVCGCMYTAETQKGHAYYHCTNGRGNCEAKKKYLTSDDVDVLLSEMFLKLKFDEELIEISGEAYKAKNDGKNLSIQTTLDTLNDELSSLNQKESALVDGLTSKIIREEVYKEKLLDIENKRTTLNKQIAEIKAKGGVSVSTFEQIKSILLDGNRATKEYLESNPEKKRKLLEKLLSNASIENGKVAQYKFKSPYSILASIEKKDDFLVLCVERDSNPRSPKALRLQRSVIATIRSTHTLTHMTVSYFLARVKAFYHDTGYESFRTSFSFHLL